MKEFKESNLIRFQVSKNNDTLIALVANLETAIQAVLVDTPIDHLEPNMFLPCMRECFNTFKKDRHEISLGDDTYIIELI